MDAKEEAVEVVETALDTIESTSQAVKNNPALLAGVAAVGLTVGAFGGYHFAKKKLKVKYEELANEEIRQAKEFYSALNEKPSPVDLAERYEDEVTEEDILARKAVAAFQDYAGGKTVREEDLAVSPGEDPAYTEDVEGQLVEEVVEVRESIRRNVFDNASSEDDLDYEEEMRNRTGDRPYVISKEEFLQGDQGFEQATLTYYEGDDVLTDDRDAPIDDTEGVVGNANLFRFGLWSDDKNVVYVRNEDKELDFEIVRSTGKYSQEVAGFIEHSESSRLRRFRSNDG